MASPEPRLALAVRLIAAGTLFCLAFSGSLWLSTRLYPLTPAFSLVPAFPWPLDAAAVAVLVGLLVTVLVRPLARLPSAAVVGLLAVLFAQDQSRLWPSFYSFFLLFLLVLGHERRDDPRAAARTFAGMQFTVAAIYFWGGVHKLTPHFFTREFPWLIEPLTSRVPIPASWVPWLGAAAAVFEVTFAIGLLTRRWRRFALWEALAMHAVVFVCIGPIRGHWNDSAWAWSLSMAAIAWTLFHDAPPFELTLATGGTAAQLVPRAIVAALVGVMPALNGVNRWDSAVSFNVYTGNVATGLVLLEPDAAKSLPPAVAAHVMPGDEWAVLDLNAWAIAEFNAGAYPERRIFRRLFAEICRWVPANAAHLVVVDKATWFAPKTTRIERWDDP